MKDLKNYLHLYLGCEVICFLNSENPAVKPVKAILCAENHNKHGFISLNAALVVHAKPILRPISDMTEEEAREGEIWGVWHDVNLMGEDWDTFGFSPHNFKHLLSKGFDLFGLIEAGLAIDKSTLKQSTTI